MMAALRSVWQWTSATVGVLLMLALVGALAVGAADAVADVDWSFVWPLLVFGLGFGFGWAARADSGSR